MFISRFVFVVELLLLLVVVFGGCGRAKGFKGPVAPADTMCVDGEGGGRTTPEEWEDVSVLGALLSVTVAVEPGGDEAPVPLPPVVPADGDGSSGIASVRTGRVVVEKALPVRRGGVGLSCG